MNRQRGSITLALYGIAALAVVTLIGGVLWKYNSTLAENARLQSANTTLTQAHSEQLAENALMQIRQSWTQALLAERQGARNAAETIERKIDAKLNQIASASPQARAWLDTAVPADLLAGVRHADAGAGGQNSPRGAAAEPAAAPRDS